MTEIDYERIDSYLSGKLSPAERIVFEAEMQANPGLRGEVELYASVDQQLLLKGTLESLNEAYFRKRQSTPAKILPMRQARFYRTIASVAAILVVAVAVYFVGFRKDSVSQLADRYVQDQMAYISPTMGGGADSIQLGIKAYNEKRYAEAEKIFAEVAGRDPGNIKAMENLGRTYLREQEYDKAIDVFQDLSRVSLLDNPAFFLQSVALLERNKPGDKERAKSLLKIVIANNYEGAEQATEWLDRW
jgi:tetratricopeptide (TPR) repeat protein